MIFIWLEVNESNSRRTNCPEYSARHHVAAHSIPKSLLKQTTPNIHACWMAVWQYMLARAAHVFGCIVCLCV